MKRGAPQGRAPVHRAAVLVIASLLLGPGAPGPASAADQAASQVTSTVTKVTVMRHRLSFHSGSDELTKSQDKYLGFVESLKSKDVVGLFLLYGADAQFVPFGVDSRSLRVARLRAAFKPIEAWLTERGLDASIVDIQGSASNPMFGLDLDTVTVEVLVKRR